MTRLMNWTGLFATMAMLIIIPVYILREPTLQAEIVAARTEEALHIATDLYAENCVVCHGAAGEGLATNPALDSEALRTIDPATLERIISRGVDGSIMAGWHVDEGGVFSQAQVEALMTLVYQGDWAQVETRVAALGLTPPDVAVVLAPSEDVLEALAALPDGEALVAGLTLYGENCAACHGSAGEGTVLAPALNDPTIAATDDDTLARIINYGVSGTIMAGWSQALAPEDVDALVTLLQQWDVMTRSGVALAPAPTPEPVVVTPEMIAAGDRLYHIACANCHGDAAYGTALAPALNNQTFLAETPDAALAQIIALGVPGTVMPAWGGRLSEADIQSLVAYLRSLEAAALPIVTP